MAKACDHFLVSLKTLGERISTCDDGVEEAVFDVISHAKSREAKHYFCNDYLATISNNASLSELYHYAYNPYTGDKDDEIASADPSYYRTITDCRGLSAH